MKVIIDIPKEVLEHPHNYCCYALANQIKGNYTPIPDNATNGDMIIAMFPNIESRLDENTGIMLVKWDDGTTKMFKASWWNSPYKRGSDNE